MKKALLLLLPAFLLMACSAPSTDQYVEFLYENMSMPDSVDYSREYFTEQARIALQARTELPWGKTVPEREFRHFVLPPRVNNEDLDDFRTTYYEELRDRVQSLGMTEAVLEVNHWCHEHVTYRPTSARTLGPASTVRTAYGRCGEESVLLVAALRTVGIPARQVYTPRWAHTDDNHAWVEAWADGQWYFLGACEPEPVLNLGWFNESASRGMLMHTKAFGNYDGPEEVVSQQHHLTEINVTDIYAPTRRLTVTVLDTFNNPIPDATVEFKLYNYAEFYTVARKQTDANGQASLTAGLGDMLVWATAPSVSPSSSSSGAAHTCAPSLLAFQKVSFATDSLVTLRLSSAAVPAALAAGLSLNITPPAPSASLPTVTPDQRAENNRRLAIEDSIRHAYEATMPDQRSRGNHTVITAFRDSAAAHSQSVIAEQLLTTLPDKDLQDVTLDILLDNLLPCPAFSGLPDDITLPYLLSPRIERERLTAFKAPLRTALKTLTSEAQSDNMVLASSLISWTRDSITIIEDRNPQRLRMTPLGVYRSRKADRLGRDIFFVAACRALGIPARINEINGKVQYFGPSAIPSSSSALTWNDVTFESVTVAEGAPEGTLHLTYAPTPHLPDVKYYIHFTLSRLDENNRLQLLTYPEEATFQNTFRDGVTLDAGTYVLTTGVRMASGSVRALLQAFEVKENATVTLPITLRTATDAVAVIGSLNAEDLYQPLEQVSGVAHNNEPPTSLLATCGRGYYAIGLIAPNQEPTNHALRDISLVREDLEKWGRKLVLLLEDADAASRFNFAEFNNLPATTVWGTDIDGAIKQEIMEQMHLTSASLPIFLICDSFNRVVFVQQGYTIGLGEQLLKVIHQL
ncbi:MAG: transglutaminase domain-containing protein [Bacteroidaceae bacterium]|nr:transglutaminase domain-containing protein [Bacteroidaceae bacterium]